jgi:hypothetical protein
MPSRHVGPLCDRGDRDTLIESGVDPGSDEGVQLIRSVSCRGGGYRDERHTEDSSG